MKNKKALKIGLLFSTFVASATIPIGVVYTINSSIKGKKYSKFKASKTLLEPVKKEKELTFDEIWSKILKGEISLLDLKVKDFIKMIEWIRSDKPNLINSQLQQIAPKIFEKIRKIDIEDFRLIFNILLNKGLKNIKKEEFARLEKMLLSFADKKYASWISDLFKYLPIVLYEGLQKLFNQNDYEFFNKFIPQIINTLVDKLIVKPRRENKTQKAKREKRKKDLKVSLLNLFRKFLIDGFSSKDVLIDDVVKVIFQIKELPKTFEKDINGYKVSVPMKTIIKTYITNFINALTIPSKVAITKEIQEKKNDIQSIEKTIGKLEQEIKDKKTTIGEIENSKKISEQEFKLLKSKFDSFKTTDPYSFLMLKLGINQEHLEDVNNSQVINKDYEHEDYEGKTNKFLSNKWYEDKYKRLWVLARSLWHKYPGENDSYEKKKLWYKKTETSWKFGITKKPTMKRVYKAWWDIFGSLKVDKKGGGASSDPTDEFIFDAVKKAYDSDAVEWIKNKSKDIKNNLDLLKKNEKKPIKTFDGYKQILEYENKQKQIKKLNDLIENKQEVIKSKSKILQVRLNQLEELEENPAFIYENKNKITKDILLKNEFFNGKGITNLSVNDLTNIVYKLQDLFLNIKKHHDITIDKTISELIPIAVDSLNISSFFKPFAKIAVSVFATGTIKTEVNKQVLPLIDQFITEELITKIKFINPKKISILLDEIIKKGIINIKNSTLIYTVEVIRKFIKIEKFTNRELFNIILIIKGGLITLPKTSRAIIIKTIIQSFNTSEDLMVFIKLFI